MKIVILRSVADDDWNSVGDAYHQEFDTLYAERVISNLRGGSGYCTSCGPDCISCHESYGRQFGGSIVGVLDFPSVLPYVLEHPESFITDRVPDHDILMVINIHEQILLEFLKVCRKWGTKGVVVPVEEPGWISGAARASAVDICAGLGIEIAFPKPFCAFRPDPDSILGEFRRTFHIGYPAVNLDVRDGIIESTHVDVSAACGATYYIARWLRGRRIEDNIEIEVIAKGMSSYPCTASMEREPELGGDTPMHVASDAHTAILDEVKPVRSTTGEMIMSPFGQLIARPLSAMDNIKGIEKARAAILERLDIRDELTISDLRNIAGVTPSAVSSALLLLKQEGRIRIDSGAVVSRM